MSPFAPLIELAAKFFGLFVDRRAAADKKDAQPIQMYDGTPPPKPQPKDTKP